MPVESDPLKEGPPPEGLESIELRSTTPCPCASYSTPMQPRASTLSTLSTLCRSACPASTPPGGPIPHFSAPHPPQGPAPPRSPPTPPRGSYTPLRGLHSPRGSYTPFLCTAPSTGSHTPRLPPVPHRGSYTPFSLFLTLRGSYTPHIALSVVPPFPTQEALPTPPSPLAHVVFTSRSSQLSSSRPTFRLQHRGQGSRPPLRERVVLFPIPS